MSGPITAGVNRGIALGLQERGRREELRFQKEKRDQELKIMGYDPETMNVIPGSPADVEKAKNAQTLQMYKALEGKLAAQDTDTAILDFSETGDAKYLQNALDKNPALKNAWAQRGVLNVGNLDWQNDSDLLKKNGFNTAEYDTEEKQNLLRKNVYKFYDGKQWKLGMLNNVMAETGAMQRLGKHRAQGIVNNYKQFREFMAGPRSSPNTAEGHKFESEIMQASDSTGVPANLLAAMTNVDSDLSPAKENIAGNAERMKELLTKYNGDTRLALAAFAGGEANVDKHNGVPPMLDTQKYVSTVLNNFSNGESYYVDNTAIQEGQQMGPQSMVNPPNIEDLNNRQKQYLDNRIATIQNFIRGNANAAQGTTNKNEDTKVDLAKQEAKNQSRGLDIRERELITKIQENFIKLRTDGSTTVQKDLVAAENQTIDLLNKFGGEDNFFNTDFSNEKNFNKAWQNVVKINKLEGTELTQKDKENITEIRGLISLAGPASRLSSTQTGIVDKTLSDFKKYVSESVPKADRTAAMASFRNSLKHALFGSAQTEGEIKAFNEAFGTNKQKLGPVLRQFKVALTQVQDKLDSAAKLGNPYTMHVMVGADRNKLNNIRSALQQRIDYIEGRQPVQQKPSLDSIFEGAAD